MSGRPLDVLEAAVGDDVEVRLKSGETYRGTLAGYDQHMNLVLDDVVASASSEEAEPSDDSNAESDDGSSVDVRDTTIIRGDNVVSITP
ncbi:small nuclear ribonucleoprotein [Salinarchaeum sp. Harcht-Bsk1]|uniref:LSM domain-containing protein n=1 Tax=Salinarchaeum sp. Harcht-Bsk1 TaxID=1333523 RepID=UPI00034229E0|nr:LSM domain-containing protein [Salinarchaeum sp. Harcht-Bsk1]AGN02626.1 small nuclear ribonucleoprotein [Salinarchaeum sp. Harcht-Bsk1]